LTLHRVHFDITHRASETIPWKLSFGQNICIRTYLKQIRRRNCVTTCVYHVGWR